MFGSPTLHHKTLGIHPGAFVQPDPPDTTQVQDGVLWIDTSSGPPYQMKVWNATEGSGWEVVGSAALSPDGCFYFPSGASVCAPGPDDIRIVDGDDLARFVASYAHLIMKTTPHSFLAMTDSSLSLTLNGFEALDVPFPTSTTHPAYVLGGDTPSGRPHWKPVLQPPPFTAVPPTPPPATPDICVQVRCGVAVACTNHLTSLYGQWANWINAGLAALGGLLAAAALTAVVDPLVDAAYALVWSELKGALEALTADVLAQGCGAISPDMATTLIKALFCALTCTGDVVALDAAAVAQWANTLISQGWPGFDQLEAIVLAALIRNTPLPEWQAVAARAGQSSQCDAMTCP